jgi:hypothetical protein
VYASPKPDGNVVFTFRQSKENVFSFLRLSFSKQKKTRELGRLENLRILCLEDIRNLAYPHFSFTRGRVRTPAGATTSGKMLRLLKCIRPAACFQVDEAPTGHPNTAELFVTVREWPDHR